jgi:hypothetical protein
VAEYGLRKGIEGGLNKPGDGEAALLDGRLRNIGIFTVDFTLDGEIGKIGLSGVMTAQTE